MIRGVHRSNLGSGISGISDWPKLDSAKQGCQSGNHSPETSSPIWVPFRGLVCGWRGGSGTGVLGFLRLDNLAASELA